MEQAQEGVAGGVQFAHLLVTSSEFRNELADALTVIQSSLRRTKEQPRSEPHPGREAEEEEEYIESEEEEEYGQQQGEESGGGQGVLGGGKGKGKDFQRLSQEQVDRKAQRFVRLLKRLQQKPQYQESLRFLVGRLRTAFAMGGLHAERIERQLEASEAGRAFVSETEQAKVCGRFDAWLSCKCVNWGVHIMFVCAHGRGGEIERLLNSLSLPTLHTDAQDHAIRLIEAWMEASLAPFFGALSRVNDQMQNDAATREELGGLGRFVEGQLKGTAFKESEERVVAEAKDHFGRVRERLLSAWVAFLLLCLGESKARHHLNLTRPSSYHLPPRSPLRRADPPRAGRAGGAGRHLQGQRGSDGAAAGREPSRARAGVRRAGPA